MENKSKKEKFVTTNILNSIIVGVVVALVTSIISYFFWTRQNMSTKQQKLFDQKISLLDKFANDASFILCYWDFVIKIQHEKYKFEIKIKDSLKNINGDPSLNSLPRDYIKQKVESLYPYDYSMYKKGMERYYQSTSTFALIPIMFNERVSVYSDSLHSIINQDATSKEMLHFIKKNNIDLLKIPTDTLCKIICEKEMDLGNKALNAMYNEIKENQ